MIKRGETQCSHFISAIASLFCFLVQCLSNHRRINSTYPDSSKSTKDCCVLASALQKYIEFSFFPDKAQESYAHQ
ncbi:hypothetical protein BX666DRAFT_1891651 [Dichotomocladium elegans]|nr:hypothetical protein BX666DRAFT_1891651 [Dichotomocladium elegans]